MGGCLSSLPLTRPSPTVGVQISEKRKSREIQKLQNSIALIAQQSLQEMNLVLYGTSDSGKTTLRKQLVNIYGQGYSDPGFRRGFAPLVIENLLDGALSILHYIKEEYAEAYRILKLEASEKKGYLSPIAADTLINLITYQDPNFCEVWAKRPKGIQIADCFDAFACQLRDPTWGGDNWIPSVDDCIRASEKTNGVVKVRIQVDYLRYCIVDVGGERGERRKWPQILHPMCENTTPAAAIFVASLSEYDQSLLEDSNVNRLEETLQLFQQSLSWSWIAKCAFLLFLNKKDIFDQKFLRDKIALNVSGKFPTAPKGDKVTAEQAIGWISNEFIRRRKARFPTSASNFVHVVTAADSGNVRQVFEQSKIMIFERAMKNMGLLSENGMKIADEVL